MLGSSRTPATRATTIASVFSSLPLSFFLSLQWWMTMVNFPFLPLLFLASSPSFSRAFLWAFFEERTSLFFFSPFLSTPWFLVRTPVSSLIILSSTWVASAENLAKILSFLVSFLVFFVTSVSFLRVSCAASFGQLASMRAVYVHLVNGEKLVSFFAINYLVSDHLACFSDSPSVFP